MQTVADYVVAIVIIGALAIGLLSMLVGQAERLWDYVMSRRTGSPTPDPGSRTSSDVVVRPQQNQVEPELVRDFEQVVAWLRSHNLTDDQAITLLALMHRESGDHFLSANKILEGVGGTAAEVKAQIAALRPKPPQPRTQGHADRPANGW